MDFLSYQKQLQDSYHWPKDMGESYLALGLTGEAGEVADEVKKMYRDDCGVITSERRERLIEELGDVLWYVAAIATDIGADLNEIAVGNLLKAIKRNSERKANDIKPLDRKGSVG